MNKNGYKKLLDGARSSYQAELEKIGEKFRKEVLIPVCDKYNIEFLSGNGTFFFKLPGEDNWLNQVADRTCDDFPRFLQNVYEVLNHDFDHNEALYYYVDSYQKQDKR